MNEALKDPEYLDFVSRSQHRVFRLVVDGNILKMRTLPAQVAGMIEGLIDRASKHGFDFTTDSVCTWFDKQHNDEYLMTKMGAVRIFIYYLPRLKDLGLIVEL